MFFRLFFSGVLRVVTLADVYGMDLSYRCVAADCGIGLLDYASERDNYELLSINYSHSGNRPGRPS